MTEQRSVNFDIRPEVTGDENAIRQVNQLAFGRDAEANLVDALRSGGYSRISLISETGGKVIGHIFFSDLPIITSQKTISALALAPIAVIPEFQRRSIGSQLIRHGLDACRNQGFEIVVVLGHRNYYPRFGFSSERARKLASIHSGEDFMAIELVVGALDGVVGRIEYPPPFDAV
jgi:putative acetyltransferase